MVDESGVAVVLELERLRGAVNEGFARIDGRWDGMNQRTTENEKDIEKADRQNGERFAAIDRRLTSLERKVWIAAGAAAVAAGGSAAGIWSLIHP